MPCFCLYYHGFYVQTGTSIASNGCLYDDMQYSTLTPSFYVSFIIIKYKPCIRAWSNARSNVLKAAWYSWSLTEIGK